MKVGTIAVFGFELERENIVSALRGIKGMNFHFFSGAELQDKGKRRDAIDYVVRYAAAVMIKNEFWDDNLDKFIQMLRQAAPTIPIIPLGSEMVRKNVSNIDAENVQKINSYFIYGGSKNILNALIYIKTRFLEGKQSDTVPEPQPVPFDGIFHPMAESVFASLEDYLAWYQGYRKENINYISGQTTKACWIGLLINRRSWVSDNLEVERALIKELETVGFGVIPVFAHGTKETGVDTKNFSELVRTYFSRGNALLIDALINLQIFVSTEKGNAMNIFEQAVTQMKKLNVPVFRPLVSYVKNLEMWMEGMDGLVTEIPWSFTASEMQGMIEFMLIGCRDKEGKAIPVYERIVKFVARVTKWMDLKNKPRKEKKLAIFLHNAPCSGVEATIGMAAGMDASASVITILERLKNDGWQIDGIPRDGKELHKLIMSRKAYSDFRWTSVEEIADSGGCIYQMPMDGQNGYMGFYQRLDPLCRKQMEEAWGHPPGEGMVLDNNLIITGVNFGNVAVLVQPKRGCHSAKCTGEVCKILQDPQCPPPHQYFATYKYVEEIFQADAVLHVGTHGSLEFLPGKTNALSYRCYPDVVLGSLPNLYIYNAGVGTEAIMAKRRSHAVIVDHLPPIYRAEDNNAMQLVQEINDYLEAQRLHSEQALVLEQQIRQRLETVRGAKEVIEKTESFHDGLIQLKGMIVQSLASPRNERLHQFGLSPASDDAFWYIKEVIDRDMGFMEHMKEYIADEYTLHILVMGFIEQVVYGDQLGSVIADQIFPMEMDDRLQRVFDNLGEDIRDIYDKLQLTDRELDSLVNVLNGGYVPPGPSGMPDDNGRNILPTGRNLYLLNVDKIPIKAAYEVGMKLADALLELFLKEENRYPEKVAINMFSLDISRSKGEQLSQVLYLLGIRPTWDKNGKVTGLEVIPLEQLNRPRIDVTVRITGVLRDTYPQIYEMLDQAVIMVVSLPEPEEYNFVKKHTRQITEALKHAGIDNEIERRSTIRIFGDKPGTYGAGVDLALKASAWETDTDLAKTFIYFSSYAYGKALQGDPARHEFVENVKNAEISYDSSNSKRYDLLTSGFGASVQGGFRLIKKVLQGKEIKQYHGSSENHRLLRVTLLEEKLHETVEQTLLNPLWKENMKEKGYEGGAQLMQRLQNVFEWQCLTDEIDDKTIDRIVTNYVNDPRMQQWFNENNQYALEEVARRFLELYQRGRWEADPTVLDELKASYLAIEGDMEEQMGEVKGDIQAGNIEVVRDSDIKAWQEKLKEVDELFK